MFSNKHNSTQSLVAFEYRDWALMGLVIHPSFKNMVSIKDRITKMIRLADGELVRHCHALEAGLLVGDIKPNLGLKKKSKR